MSYEPKSAIPPDLDVEMKSIGKHDLPSSVPNNPCMAFDVSRKTEPDKILSNIAKYVEEKLADRKPEETSTLHGVEETNNSKRKPGDGSIDPITHDAKHSMAHVPNDPVASYEPKSSIAYDPKSIVSTNFQEFQEKTSEYRNESQCLPDLLTSPERKINSDEYRKFCRKRQNLLYVLNANDKKSSKKVERQNLCHHTTFRLNMIEINVRIQI